MRLEWRSQRPHLPGLGGRLLVVMVVGGARTVNSPGDRRGWPPPDPQAVGTAGGHLAGSAAAPLLTDPVVLLVFARCVIPHPGA